MERMMTEEITVELFEHLVELAALSFDPTEVEYLRRELNNQLKALRFLVEVPMSTDMPLEVHGVPYTPQTSPPLREDLWEPCENPDEIMAQAPQVEEGYIIVPDIPRTEME
jgi:aspartyl-tRNA(Asn)/glutamyl-tRNA(Gln) amidotransferase subunit C